MVVTRRPLGGADVDVRLLGLIRRSGGYLLDLEPHAADVHRFAHWVRLARGDECPAQRRESLLRGALDLWRGEPLAGLPGEWVARVRQAWQRQRVGAAVAWAEAAMATGASERVIDGLTGLAVEHPLVEPLHAALMRALHAAGRSAEALAHYAAVAQRLAGELGTDPGAELRGLHAAILRGTAGPPSLADRRVPTLLPAPVAAFAGRLAETGRLNEIFANDGRDRPSRC
jgi:DNA-binding SARP family transcriptional activator